MERSSRNVSEKQYAHRSSIWMRMVEVIWITVPVCKAPPLESSVIHPVFPAELPGMGYTPHVRSGFWLLRGYYTGEVDDVRPIPRSLLIHSGELLEEVKGDWGSSGLNHLEDLRKIRIDPSSKVVRDKNNAEIQLAATMIYCCKNSRPSGRAETQDRIRGAILR